MAKVVTGAHPKIKDFYEAYWFLYEHPIFKMMVGVPENRFEDHRFQDALDVSVVKVNPKNNRQEWKKDPVTGKQSIDHAKNTATRVWLECGPWLKPDGPEALEMNKQNPGIFPSHGMASLDTDLDCGGATFEEAIVKLANLVLQKYGNYPKPAD